MNVKNLHPSIGPHEGLELELMLENKKNISLFYSNYEIPDGFNKYIKDKVFFLKKVEFKTLVKGFYIDFFIIYKENCEEDVEFLIFNIKKSIESYNFNPDVERNIGKLLGYSDNDIEFYIENSIKNKKKE